MPSSFYRIRVHVDNLLLRRHIEEAVLKKSEFIIQDVKDSEKTDLLFLEIGSNPDHTFALVQSLASNGQVGEIFLASESEDQDILIKALRSGAREFFGPGTDELDITAALERFSCRQTKACQDPSKSCQIITVMGCKGGVGATTIAVNLAVSLAGNGKKHSTAILDTNLFGDIPLFLETENSYLWSEIVKNISRLDSTYLKHILSKEPSGVHVLPSPSMLDDPGMPVSDVFERLSSVMSTMFDYLIVDAGPGINDASLKILQMSDKILLIGIQNLPCLAKTKDLLNTFRDLGFPDMNKVHLVLNRYVSKTDITREDIEKSLDRKLFWALPNDYSSTISAINNGRPLARTAPRKEITKSFAKMAETLTRKPGEEEIRKKKWWFF